MTAPTCDMEADCTAPITHLDDKGWVYCTPHGEQRQMSHRCRKLRPHELARINRGDTVRSY